MISKSCGIYETYSCEIKKLKAVAKSYTALEK